MEYNELFKKSCLVQLTSSVWIASRTVEQGVMEEMGTSNEWLKGKKFLINPELLGPIKTCVHQARNTIQRYSLPFPITSIYLVPKDTIEFIDEQLQLYNKRFWDKVNAFKDQYQAARKEAKQVLGKLFNESDYPEDVARKFHFEWRFLTLDVPGKTSILPPEIYVKEKKKFQSLMEETRELAMVALREEFGQVINHLVEKLSENGGKPKILAASMFNKFHEFLEEFNSRNLFQDDTLKELVEKAKSVVGGMSGYSLRYNQGLRSTITNEMNTLKKAIDEAIEDMPIRKIRMAA